MTKKYNLVHAKGGSFKQINFGDLGLRSYKDKQDQIINALERNRLQTKEVRKGYQVSLENKLLKEEKNRKQLQILEDEAWQFKREAMDKRQEQEIKNLAIHADEARKSAEYWSEFSTTFSSTWGKLADGIQKTLDKQYGDRAFQALDEAGITTDLLTKEENDTANSFDIKITTALGEINASNRPEAEKVKLRRYLSSLINRSSASLTRSWNTWLHQNTNTIIAGVESAAISEGKNYNSKTVSELFDDRYTELLNMFGMADKPNSPFAVRLKRTFNSFKTSEFSRLREREITNEYKQIYDNKLKLGVVGNKGEVVSTAVLALQNLLVNTQGIHPREALNTVIKDILTSWVDNGTFPSSIIAEKAAELVTNVFAIPNVNDRNYHKQTNILLKFSEGKPLKDEELKQILYIKRFHGGDREKVLNEFSGIINTAVTSSQKSEAANIERELNEQNGTHMKMLRDPNYKDYLDPKGPQYASQLANLYKQGSPLIQSEISTMVQFDDKKHDNIGLHIRAWDAAVRGDMAMVNNILPQLTEDQQRLISTTSKYFAPLENSPGSEYSKRLKKSIQKSEQVTEDKAWNTMNFWGRKKAIPGSEGASSLIMNLWTDNYTELVKEWEQKNPGTPLSSNIAKGMSDKAWDLVDKTINEGKKGNGILALANHPHHSGKVYINFVDRETSGSDILNQRLNTLMVDSGLEGRITNWRNEPGNRKKSFLEWLKDDNNGLNLPFNNTENALIEGFVYKLSIGESQLPETLVNNLLILQRSFPSTKSDDNLPDHPTPIDAFSAYLDALGYEDLLKPGAIEHLAYSQETRGLYTSKQALVNFRNNAVCIRAYDHLRNKKFRESFSKSFLSVNPDVKPTYEVMGVTYDTFSGRPVDEEPVDKKIEPITRPECRVLVNDIHRQRLPKIPSMATSNYLEKNIPKLPSEGGKSDVRDKQSPLTTSEGGKSVEKTSQEEGSLPQETGPLTQNLYHHTTQRIANINEILESSIHIDENQRVYGSTEDKEKLVYNSHKFGITWDWVDGQLVAIMDDDHYQLV